MRTIAELVELLKTDPGALTAQEMAFVQRVVKQRKKIKANDDRYEKHKSEARERQASIRTAGQEVGPHEPPKDQGRKDTACASLKVFCETYFAHRFYLGWSPDHLAVIARFEEAIRDGGLFALAMPRASGKTSIVEVACLWATVTGLHKFVLLIGSSREHALEMIASIKEELNSNVLFADDFGEVSHYIAALEDRANRCKGQHVNGQRTKTVWSTDKIVLPTIEGSKASGATIRVAGITGRIRGAKKDSLRPSLCILDDPQTDTSAASLSQCEKRQRIISGAVLGLAGPGKKITAIMPCTVIRRGDLADTTLDRDKSPLWTGQRFKMLYKFPEKSDLWETYGTLRADEFRNDGDGSKATAWYVERRAEMDTGAVVAWPERFEPGEVSGIQHAMNLLLADKWSFWAERQNEPLSEDLGDGQLDADEIGKRVNGLARGVVPLGCSHVTGFVDVQQRCLFYLICGWRDDFTGSVLHYGAWPDQGRRYFTSGDVQKTIGRAFAGAGIEGQIHGALGKLTEELFPLVWKRDGDGAEMKLERLLIDAGFQGDAVKSFCRTSPYAAMLMPSHGHGVGAKSLPWENYDRSRCEKLGLHWMIPKLASSKGSRHVTIDTNYWKSFIAARLKQAIGDKGSLTMFGKPGHDHKMLSDHICSEYWIETEGRGRKVHEWRMRPSTTENHWWDCLVGNAVAASMLGCEIMGQGSAQKPKRYSIAELQAAAQQRKKQSA